MELQPATRVECTEAYGWHEDPGIELPGTKKRVRDRYLHSAASSVNSINDHEHIEQRQIDHRRVQETLSRELGASQRGLISKVETANAENDCRCQIERAGVRDQSPRQTGDN